MPFALGTIISAADIAVILPNVNLLVLKRLIADKTARTALCMVVPLIRFERDQSQSSIISDEFSKSYKLVLPNITTEAYWDSVLHTNGGINGT